MLMLWGGLVALGLLGFRAIPDALLRPLENLYPVPTAEVMSQQVGIIVLGGALEHPASFVAHGQVRLENSSRNTRENAQLMAKLLGERCLEPWLLVTSAWHMPRSMTEFEAVGCKVTPYPVDFRTGRSTPLTEYSLAQSLVLWQTALHEYIGLVFYGMTR